MRIFSSIRLLKKCLNEVLDRGTEKNVEETQKRIL